MTGFQSGNPLATCYSAAPFRAAATPAALFRLMKRTEYIFTAFKTKHGSSRTITTTVAAAATMQYGTETPTLRRQVPPCFNCAMKLDLCRRYSSVFSLSVFPSRTNLLPSFHVSLPVTVAEKNMRGGRTCVTAVEKHSASSFSSAPHISTRMCLRRCLRNTVTSAAVSTAASMFSACPSFLRLRLFPLAKLYSTSITTVVSPAATTPLHLAHAHAAVAICSRARARLSKATSMTPVATSPCSAAASACLSAGTKHAFAPSPLSSSCAVFSIGAFSTAAVSTATAAQSSHKEDSQGSNEKIHSDSHTTTDSRHYHSSVITQLIQKLMVRKQHLQEEHRQQQWHQQNSLQDRKQHSSADTHRRGAPEISTAKQSTEEYWKQLTAAPCEERVEHQERVTNKEKLKQEATPAAPGAPAKAVVAHSDRIYGLSLEDHCKAITSAAAAAGSQSHGCLYTRFEELLSDLNCVTENVDRLLPAQAVLLLALYSCEKLLFMDHRGHAEQRVPAKMQPGSCTPVALTPAGEAPHHTIASKPKSVSCISSLAVENDTISASSGPSSSILTAAGSIKEAEHRVEVIADARASCALKAEGGPLRSMSNEHAKSTKGDSSEQPNGGPQFDNQTLMLLLLKERHLVLLRFLIQRIELLLPLLPGKTMGVLEAAHFVLRIECCCSSLLSSSRDTNNSVASDVTAPTQFAAHNMPGAAAVKSTPVLAAGPAVATSVGIPALSGTAVNDVSAEVPHKNTSVSSITTETPQSLPVLEKQCSSASSSAPDGCRSGHENLSPSSCTESSAPGDFLSASSDTSTCSGLPAVKTEPLSAAFEAAVLASVPDAVSIDSVLGGAGPAVASLYDAAAAANANAPWDVCAADTLRKTCNSALIPPSDGHFNTRVRSISSGESSSSSSGQLSTSKHSESHCSTSGISHKDMKSTYGNSSNSSSRDIWSSLGDNSTNDMRSSFENSSSRDIKTSLTDSSRSSSAVHVFRLRQALLNSCWRFFKSFYLHISTRCSALERRRATDGASASDILQVFVFLLKRRNAQWHAAAAAVTASACGPQLRYNREARTRSALRAESFSQTPNVLSAEEVDVGPPVAGAAVPGAAVAGAAAAVKRSIRTVVQETLPEQWEVATREPQDRSRKEEELAVFEATTAKEGTVATTLVATETDMRVSRKRGHQWITASGQQQEKAAYEHLLRCLCCRLASPLVLETLSPSEVVHMLVLLAQLQVKHPPLLAATASLLQKWLPSSHVYNTTSNNSVSNITTKHSQTHKKRSSNVSSRDDFKEDDEKCRHREEASSMSRLLLTRNEWIFSRKNRTYVVPFSVREIVWLLDCYTQLDSHNFHMLLMSLTDALVMAPEAANKSGNRDKRTTAKNQEGKHNIERRKTKGEKIDKETRNTSLITERYECATKGKKRRTDKEEEALSLHQMLIVLRSCAAAKLYPRVLMKALLQRIPSQLLQGNTKAETTTPATLTDTSNTTTLSVLPFPSATTGTKELLLSVSCSLPAAETATHDSNTAAAEAHQFAAAGAPATENANRLATSAAAEAPCELSATDVSTLLRSLARLNLRHRDTIAATLLLWNRLLLQDGNVSTSSSNRTRMHSSSTNGNTRTPNSNSSRSNCSNSESNNSKSTISNGRRTVKTKPRSVNTESSSRKGREGGALRSSSVCGSTADRRHDDFDQSDSIRDSTLLLETNNSSRDSEQKSKGHRNRIEKRSCMQPQVCVSPAEAANVIYSLYRLDVWDQHLVDTSLHFLAAVPPHKLLQQLQVKGAVNLLLSLTYFSCGDAYFYDLLLPQLLRVENKLKVEAVTQLKIVELACRVGHTPFSFTSLSAASRDLLLRIRSLLKEPEALPASGFQDDVARTARAIGYHSYAEIQMGPYVLDFVKPLSAAEAAQLFQERVEQQLTGRRRAPFHRLSDPFEHGLDVQGIVLEVDGPQHFYRDSFHWTSSSKLKHRLLTKLGFKVVHIPYFDWIKLSSESMRRAYLQCALSRAQSSLAADRDELCKALLNGRDTGRELCYTFNYSAPRSVGDPGDPLTQVVEGKVINEEARQALCKVECRINTEKGFTAERDTHDGEAHIGREEDSLGFADNAREEDTRKSVHEDKQAEQISSSGPAVNEQKSISHCTRPAAKSTVEDEHVLMLDDQRKTDAMVCSKGRPIANGGTDTKVAEMPQSCTRVGDAEVSWGKPDALTTDDEREEHVTLLAQKVSTDKGGSGTRRKRCPCNDSEVLPSQAPSNIDSGEMISQFPRSMEIPLTSQKLLSEKATQSSQQMRVNQCIPLHFSRTGCSTTAGTAETTLTSALCYMHDKEKAESSEWSHRSQCAEANEVLWSSTIQCPIRCRTEDVSLPSPPSGAHSLPRSSSPLGDKVARELDDLLHSDLLFTAGASMSPTADASGVDETARSVEIHPVSPSSSASLRFKAGTALPSCFSGTQMHVLLSRNRREDPRYRKKIDLLKFKRRREKEKRTAKPTGK